MNAFGRIRSSPFNLIIFFVLQSLQGKELLESSSVSENSCGGVLTKFESRLAKNWPLSHRTVRNEIYRLGLIGSSFAIDNFSRGYLRSSLHISNWWTNHESNLTLTPMMLHLSDVVGRKLLPGFAAKFPRTFKISNYAFGVCMNAFFESPLGHSVHTFGRNEGWDLGDLATGALGVLIYIAFDFRVNRANLEPVKSDS